MKMIFGSISDSAPNNYLEEKLKICRQNLTSSEIKQINQDLVKTTIPLAEEEELPDFTQAQTNVIEINKNEVLDNLFEMLPLVDGEELLEKSFSLLTEDYKEFDAHTPVFTVNSNFSTIHIPFINYKVENGSLKEIDPILPVSPSHDADSTAGVVEDVVSDGINSLIASLAEAIASEGLSWVVSQIMDEIKSHFLKSAEVRELEKYVKKAIEDDTIIKANERLHAVLHWLCNEYSEKTTTRNELNVQLQVLTEVVLPVLPRYVAALPVYAVAANTALLFCQKMDDLDSSENLFSKYAPVYINNLTQLLRDAFAIRADYVQLANDASGTYIFYQDNFHWTLGPSFSYKACKSSQYGAVTLRAQYSKLDYIWNTLYPAFSKTYDGCMKSVENWCNKNNQAIPRFKYDDRLFGLTNDYLFPDSGLVSANKEYCLVYYKPKNITEPFMDGKGRLVIFSTSDGKPIWNSGKGADAWRTYMQQDGNFVIYSDMPDGWKEKDANKLIWDPFSVEKGDPFYSSNLSAVFASNTESKEQPVDYFIIMQNDGNLVIYINGTNKPVWATNSNQ